MRSNLAIYSGIWNIGLAAFMLYPPLYHAFGMNLTQPLWGWLIAGFLLYTAATLIIGGRNIERYGSIIIHEALLRFIAAVLVIPAGLFFDYGWILVLLGIGDAAWGVVYLKSVPKQTGRSLMALLLDSVEQSPT